ncbi:GAF domain-containing protein [bacterium]|nr:GAF domain-containing protein [bacterium]
MIKRSSKSSKKKSLSTNKEKYKEELDESSISPELRDSRVQELQTLLLKTNKELDKAQVLIKACTSFSSTLDLKNLMSSIFDRIIQVLHAEAGSLWMVDDGNTQIECIVAKGGSGQSITGLKLSMDKGIVGWVVSNHKPTVVLDASKDKRFAGKIENSEFETKSMICVPLVNESECMGAIQIINKHTTTGKFDKDDLKMLSDLASFASISLSNAKLFKSRKKLQNMSHILEISRRIGSTLDLDSVLVHLVNMPDEVIPYERSSIGIWHNDKFLIAAITGDEEVDQQQYKNLSSILEGYSLLDDSIYYPNLLSIPKDNDTNQSLITELEKRDNHSFYAIPLKDSEGNIGILAFESKINNFLPKNLQEMAELLANQASVAIRNALLYDDMSMYQISGTDSPLRFGWWLRHIKIISLILGSFILLCLIPFPDKVSGDCTIEVYPHARRVFHAELEAVIHEVPFKEGDKVKKGELIAALDDEKYSLERVSLDSKMNIIKKDIEKALGNSDNIQLQKLNIQLLEIKSKIALNQEYLQKTTIISPINGTIVTPKYEDSVGRLVKKGDEIVKLVGLDEVYLQILVPEDEISMVQSQMTLHFKLASYPEMTHQAIVDRIHLIAEENENPDAAVLFSVFARLKNPQHLLLPGMTGRAKINSDTNPLGIILFRKLYNYLRMTLW